MTLGMAVIMASLLMCLAGALRAEAYQLGDAWDRRPVLDDRLGGRSAVFQRAAKATAFYGLATAFYLGKFNGHHIMAANHHIARGRCRGDAFFPLLQKSYACEKIYGDWEEVDLTLFSIRVPANEEAALLAAGRNFAYDAGIHAGQELLTLGFGAENNLESAMTFEQGPDCKIFSATDEFRLIADPDKINPVGYAVWSFANGCDISRGDSGSAFIDRKTGDVLGLQWTGKIPKSPGVADSAALRRMFEARDPGIWTELTYGVPAAKIRESIRKDLRTRSGGADWAKTLAAIIERPAGELPAPENESPRGTENIKRLWLRMLERSTALQDYDRYIRENEVEIRFVDQIEKSLVGSFYAAFENNQILINRRFVDQSMAELALQEFFGDEAEEIFARKTIDLIIHELAHARLEEEIEGELHLKPTLPLVEDEILAYSAQARALAEFQDLFSSDDVQLSATREMQASLFKAYYDGCDHIASYIRQWNPVASLRDHKELLERLDGWLRPIGASLNKMENRMQALLQGGEASPGMAREDELSQLRSTKTRMLEQQENLRRNLELFSSPENFKKIQRFYRTRLNGICGVRPSQSIEGASAASVSGTE